MYRTILVPLDGSKRAERVLPHVEELAHRFGSQVLFLHVLEHGAILPVPVGAAPYQDVIQEREQGIAPYLHSWQGEFREKGIRTRSFTEHGAVVPKIIDVAEREGVDLIAMTSHGRTGLPQVFYGSVAVGVLHRADRPILLVRSV